ncbi:MAG: histidine phosphatase family protein [Bacillus sp. (in: firmicutes)]
MESTNSIRLILIRHGMTAFNKEKKYMGYTDEPVLAGKLADYRPLRAALMHERIDAVYSSDLLRCRQTANYLFGDKACGLDSRLREIHFGDWEGKTYEELKEDPVYCDWLSNWETAAIPNGEGNADFHKRVLAFLEQVVLVRGQVGKSLAIVSHGGVIRHIVSSLCEDVAYWDVSVDFGQAIVLEVAEKGGKWLCMSSSVAPTAENGHS